jgi:acetyl-CoA synthetase
MGEKKSDKKAEKPKADPVNTGGNTIASLMDEKRVFEPSKDFKSKAIIKGMEEYQKLYKESIKDPAKFWEKYAKELDWFKKWDTVFSWNKEKAEIAWFKGGKLNASYNCLDRHITDGKRNKAALIWQGEPESDMRTFTYQQLTTEVCKFANVLKSLGVKKGDRVSIYLPMIPELPITQLACARLGAIHSIVFGGFSVEALRDRINDSECSVLVTSDGSFRSGKNIPLKENADKAVAQCPSIKHVVVVKRTGLNVTWTPKDHWWHEEMDKASVKCEAEQMDSEDPLYILYTSGSTGKPKGVLHTTAGYMLYVMKTFQWIFDYKDDDIYWCTADIGWVTGHSYITYGPLCAGATVFMFEGIPSYPKPDRFWALIEKYKINILYTAPTALRAMMKEGDDWPKKHDLSSLRLLGTVGEPINPEAWMWYYNVIGGGRCPIVDTWWQTETGGILITPIPGAIPIKPGSATLPFPGIEPAVLREDGTEAAVNEGGYLVMKKPWPGIMRTVYRNHQRFMDTYWAQFKGMYLTGDSARRDEDGYVWIMGRMDDVLKVSGHRLGTAEIESALVAHPKVAEAAVVGFPHEIKGEAIYAYVTLKTGYDGSDDLKKELSDHVRKLIGPIAKPDKIQFAPGLPKTRSGKIMRRILKKIAQGDVGNLGDTSTLADPSVVDNLVKGRQ